MGALAAAAGEAATNSEDADFAAAIAASLAPAPAAAVVVPVPDEPSVGEPGVLLLAFRAPSGVRLQRRFRGSDTVGGVAAFVAAQAGLDMSRHCLAAAYPRRQLRDLGLTLAAAGVKDKEALSVEPR